VPELTLEEYAALSASIGPLLWLALSGGEVYLRDDLVEICRTFYKGNAPSIILLPTNGLMPERIARMTEEVLRACPRSAVAVKLSVDAVGDAHDRMRGVEGAFAKTMETHGLLVPLLGRYRNFELGVNTVYCRENQGAMDEVIDRVHAMGGIRTHTVSLARGDARDPETLDVDLAGYEAAMGRLARELRAGKQPTYTFRGARIKAAQDVVQRGLIHETARTGARQLECYAGRLNLVATETGELYPCESFRPEHRLGSLREHGMDAMEVLRAEEAIRVVEKIGRECHCTHECYMMTNILFNPRFYPALLRECVRIL
jgi:radical SAM protein with 4Fe4S-binding SPASM domain